MSSRHTRAIIWDMSLRGAEFHVRRVVGSVLGAAEAHQIARTSQRFVMLARLGEGSAPPEWLTSRISDEMALLPPLRSLFDCAVYANDFEDFAVSCRLHVQPACEKGLRINIAAWVGLARAAGKEHWFRASASCP